MNINGNFFYHETLAQFMTSVESTVKNNILVQIERVLEDRNQAKSNLQCLVFFADLINFSFPKQKRQKLSENIEEISQ